MRAQSASALGVTVDAQVMCPASTDLVEIFRSAHVYGSTPSSSGAGARVAPPPVAGVPVPAPAPAAAARVLAAAPAPTAPAGVPAPAPTPGVPAPAPPTGARVLAAPPPLQLIYRFSRQPLRSEVLSFEWKTSGNRCKCVRYTCPNEAKKSRKK